MLRRRRRRRAQPAALVCVVFCGLTQSGWSPDRILRLLVGGKQTRPPGDPREPYRASPSSPQAKATPKAAAATVAWPGPAEGDLRRRCKPTTLGGVLFYFWAIPLALHAPFQPYCSSGIVSSSSATTTPTALSCTTVAIRREGRPAASQAASQAAARQREGATSARSTAPGMSCRPLA